FTVTTFVTTQTKFIEAEDADFGAAQYVTNANIGMNGPYPGGSYLGLGDQTDFDIDWHTSSQVGSAFYRPTTGLNGSKEFGSEGNDRGYFQVTDWWTLGWNSAGDWENYTRPFPVGPQWYEVYGHLASGGLQINVELSQITAGVGGTNSGQVKKHLGNFAPGRATAGWDSYEIFPLLAGPGGSQTVVNLGGTTTLRITHIGQQDVDYFALVPVTLSAATIT